MAITFFGVSSVPTDNTVNGNTIDQMAVTLTPPVSMQEGDLVLVFLNSRTGASDGISSWLNDGGQSWTEMDNFLTGQVSNGIFMTSAWCRFNGTWTNDPMFRWRHPHNMSQLGVSVLRTAALPLARSAQMLVFRPTTTSNTWTYDFAPASGSAASSTTHTVNSWTTGADVGNYVGIFAIQLGANRLRSTLTGTGWSSTGLTAQYRNTGNTNHTAFYAYTFNPENTLVASGGITISSAAAGVKGRYGFREV